MPFQVILIKLTDQPQHQKIQAHARTFWKRLQISRNKPRNCWTGLHEIKAFFFFLAQHRKQSAEWTDSLLKGRKLFAHYISDRRLISRIYKELQKLNTRIKPSGEMVWWLRALPEVLSSIPGNSMMAPKHLWWIWCPFLPDALVCHTGIHANRALIYVKYINKPIKKELNYPINKRTNEETILKGRNTDGLNKCLFIGDRVFLYSPGCPRTHHVDQIGFKLAGIHLPLPLESWD